MRQGDVSSDGVHPFQARIRRTSGLKTASEAPGVNVEANAPAVDRQVAHCLLAVAEANKIVGLKMRARLWRLLHYCVNVVIVFVLLKGYDRVRRQIQVVRWHKDQNGLGGALS